MSLYIPGIAAVIICSSPRAAPSPSKDELTTTLMKIDQTSQPPEFDRHRQQRPFISLRCRSSSPSPNQRFLQPVEGHCKCHKIFGGLKNGVTRAARSRVGNGETRPTVLGLGARHRATCQLSHPQRRGLANQTTTAGGYRYRGRRNPSGFE